MDKAKLHYVKTEVNYLGRLLSETSRKLSPIRTEAILHIPKSVTKKQLHFFLGMTVFGRQWICDYASMTGPLLDNYWMIKESKGTQITWTTPANKETGALKELLLSAPALANPGYTKHFLLYVDENNGFVNTVLTQRNLDNYHTLVVNLTL